MRSRAALLERVPLAALPIPLLLLALLFLLLSCAAPAISPEIKAEVDPSISFEELVRNPQAFQGQVVLAGGRIIGVQNLEGKTEIEVLESPLDDDDRPQGGDVSRGRFIALLEGYADPAVYSRGRLITVAGRVVGAEPRRVGQITYNYPVLDALQTHLWEEREQSYAYPNVFFSIGVGTFF